MLKSAFALCQEKSIPLTDTTGNLLFTENKNQWTENIKYKCTLQNGAIFLEKNCFTYSQYNGDEMEKIHGGSNQGKKNRNLKPIDVHGQAYRETFVNANSNVTLCGTAPASYKANYFIGNDPKHWAGNVNLYHVITYSNLYKGIDLTVYSVVSELTYDFTVSPGADAYDIQIDYDGVDDLNLADGNLVIKTCIGNNIEEKPYAYQVINGAKVEVPCIYLLDENHVSFSFPESYNRNFPLVIDPQFVFGTYTGSTSDNWGFTATYDNAGDMYIGGIVFGTGYPVTTGAYDISFKNGTTDTVYFKGQYYSVGGYNIAVAKFNSTGTNLLFATYLGGTGGNEQPQSLVVNNMNNLLIYGRTSSKNFPTTAGAFQTYNAGGWDIIVSELTSDGATLYASTYVGGGGDDGANVVGGNNWVPHSLYVNYGDNARGEIIVDNNDNVYVASCTQSANFPTTPSAFQPKINGGQQGCVFKLNNTLNIMQWSTFLGGSDTDAAYSLKIDNSDNVFVCGSTSSSDFPITPGAIQPTYQGNIDGFITKLSSNGSKILHSTYIGTSDIDQTYFLDVDSDFNVYVLGQSLGGNFPITAGTYSNPKSTQFIEGLDSTLSTKIFSTEIGSGNDKIDISPTAFMIDTCKNIYLAGWGGEVNFQGNTNGLPVTSDAFQSTTNGSDFYFMILRKNAAALLYATYFGDPNDEQHVDGGTSRFDKYGYMYEAICGGCGAHSGLPTTPGCWSSNNNSDNCNEAAVKFKFDYIKPYAIFTPSTHYGCVPLTVTFDNESFSGIDYYWNFGDGTSSTQMNPTHTYDSVGTFKVVLTVTDSTLCNSVDTVFTYIKVSNHILHATFTKTETNYCDSIGASFTNTSNGGTIFRWNFGDGDSSTLQNATHTFTKPGIDTVTLIVCDTSFCNPYDTIKDTINFTDIVTSVIQDTLYKGCAPLTIDFNDEGLGGTTFKWNFGDGTTSNTRNTSHIYDSAGVYHVSLYAYNPATCDKVDSALAKVIVYPPPPVAAFTANPTLVQYINNSAVQFTNNTTGATSYLWYFGDGDTSTAVNPSHIYDTEGVYSVCLVAKNQGPCTDSMCILITVKIVPIVGVPNAFSPNGDGVNDVLYVKGQGLSSLDFKVFNRWGEMVFESHDINIGWDGTYNGKPQEMDVYDWTLSAVALDGTPIFKKGNVTLLR